MRTIHFIPCCSFVRLHQNFSICIASMEELKPLPCSKQHVQRLCCAFKTSHRSIHNAQRVSQIRVVPCWIVDPRKRGSKTCTYYCLYPIFWEALLFSYAFQNLLSIRFFATQKINFSNIVHRSYIFSGLGWVCKWLAPQLYKSDDWVMGF